MKVELISYTNDADRLAAVCAGTCVSKEIPTEPSMNGLRSALKSGHESVIEHASFTFAVSGISRACSHQLVRHRIASYSQQSQRYVSMDDFEYVTPASIEAKNNNLLYGYIGLMDRIGNLYRRMIDEYGIPEEDARYILPNACCTNIVVTMNARELRHFLELRLCGRAQWEIRELASKMFMLAREAAPEIMKHAGPQCHFTGMCKERKWCGQEPDAIRDRIREEAKR